MVESPFEATNGSSLRGDANHSAQEILFSSQPTAERLHVPRTFDPQNKEGGASGSSINAPRTGHQFEGFSNI